MNKNLHKCSVCGKSFDPARNSLRDLSWKSVFTRAVKPLPLGEDIQSFDLVKCPDCGHVEKASELRIFGIVPGSQIKVVLGALLVVVIMFGYWLLKTTSS
jgi:DNA-directed RNA polymerase subunit RPC12/RpoP